MDGASAGTILSSISGKKVVVLGDLMLDRFIWGTVERISPEAPVPVVKVARETFHLGGAGNVVQNIASLGGVALPVGVTGTGPAGQHVREALASLRVPSVGIVPVEGRATTVKTRIVAHSQQVVRFDREHDDPLGGEITAMLTRKTLEMCMDADALVFSDYEKGCVTPLLLSEVLPAARSRGIPVIVDPKPGRWKSYMPITVMTPNQSEASRMSGIRLRTDADAVAAATAIREALGCRGILLTRGEKGMLLVEEGRDPFSIAAASREVYDVTGAGDTVVAALALCLAGGVSLREAAVIANAAAGVVVSKVGTAVATPQEVIAAI